MCNSRRLIVEIPMRLLPSDVSKSGSLHAWPLHDVDESHWHSLIKKYKLLQDGDEFESPTPTSSSSPPSSPPISLCRNILPPNPPSTLNGFDSAGVRSSMIDYLAILGLTRNANEREDVLACRKLSRK